MRLNIYAEELTDETELVTKTVTDEKFGTRTFYGVRFYLKSPPELHDDPADDDRSAITLWVPWTRVGGHDFSVVGFLLDGLRERFAEARSDDAAKRITPEQRAAYDAAVAACPEPFWHDSHVYCPACPWNENGSIVSAEQPTEAG